MLDRLWKHFKIDIAFTKHFAERMNDPRNHKQITLAELRDLFVKAYRKFGVRMSGFKADELEAVLVDINTSLNVPFVLKYDRRNDELDLVSKTVMRKKNFMTTSPKLAVEQKTFKKLMEEIYESGLTEEIHKIKRQGSYESAQAVGRYGSVQEK